MANVVNNKKDNHKVSNGKINTKKVFAKKDNFKVEEIKIDEALSSRVKRNQKLYNKPSSSNIKKTPSNAKTEKELSNTKQQKFNFDSKKIKIEDDMSNSFFSEKKKKKSNKLNTTTNKPVSVKVEDIPIKKTLKVKKKNDSLVVTMLFLAVIIVFMGVFLIYHFESYDHSKPKVKYKTVEVVPENIVFLGDSITEQYDIDKFYSDRNVVNSGVGGNKTQDILDDMKDRVYRYNPSHVFLLIGTNDIVDDVSNKDIVKNIQEIIKDIKKNLPNTKIYLESIYPINNSKDEKINHETVNDRDNDDIKEINKELKKVVKKEKINYVDLYSKLIDENGLLNLDYTKEGLHINDKGYEIVTFEINKILKDDD